MMKAKIFIRDNSDLMDGMVRAIHGMAGKENAVDVGLFGSQGSDLVEYATKNEFGDPHNTINGRPAPIPARSFIRSTFDEQRQDLHEKIAKAKVNLVLGKLDKVKFLNVIGLLLQRKIVEKIDRSPEWAVPNAPLTILKKKSDHPLIDTGRMRQSITHRVVK
ncbi:MAG: hypothetical protein AB1847_19500 [bacterium]